MRRQLLAVALASAMGIPGLALADAEQDLQAAMSALKAEEYSAAASLLRPLAEDGNAQAQYFLGNLYRAGRGLPKDAEVACEWYEKAAVSGDVRAEHDTGACYVTGLGGRVDPEKGAYWLQMAASHGLVASFCPLGELYLPPG